MEVDAAGAIREITWAQLGADVDRVATALLTLGVTPGEPVAFQLPNRLEFLAIALGTLRVGAVCEPLMPIFRERELEFMLARERCPSAVRARPLPRPRSRHDGRRAAARGCPALEHVDRARRWLRSDAVRCVARPARRWTTGGRRASRPRSCCSPRARTGEPKGVLHRHEVLDRAADAHTAHFGLTGDDVIYIPSPLAHQTGFLYGMWIALRLGAPQVIQEAWDADLGFDAIERFGVTFVQARRRSSPT